MAISNSRLEPSLLGHVINLIGVNLFGGGWWGKGNVIGQNRKMPACFTSWEVQFVTLLIHVFWVTVSNVFLTVGHGKKKKKHLKNTEVGFWKLREAIKSEEKHKAEPRLLSSYVLCFITLRKQLVFYRDAHGGWRGRKERKERDGQFLGIERFSQNKGF